jgi:glucose-1-phosphate adenylyltransferase
MTVMTAETLVRDSLVIVLGGGQGERLYPLTQDRAKPAVPFGGPYRIIDITLSNCVNSGLRRIYVLTQYKSFSLDRHLRLTWSCFDEDLNEFIVPIPPQQRIGQRWYLGTADAIYQNIYTLEQEKPKHVIVLSGDHVYKMDYMAMLQYHIEKGADATLASVEIPLAEAYGFGTVSVDEDMRINGFLEKSPEPIPIPGNPNLCLANMGVYIFQTEALVQMVTEDAKQDSQHDFGKDILPRVKRVRPVFAYPFRDPETGKPKYWRDIGTLDAYYEANMDLLSERPPFDFHDPVWPIRTHQRQRPPAQFLRGPSGEMAGTAVDSIVSAGCIIRGGAVIHSVLSRGVCVGESAEVEGCILMDDVVIGKGARLRNVIVDKRVTIPEGAVAGFDEASDRRRFAVTENGIVVVPKGVPSTESFWRS